MPPRQRPSIASAPLRLPAEPIALTPLFGRSREVITAATVGFEFAAPPTARRSVSPWLSRPLLDLVGRDGEPAERRPSRARVAAVGLAATVLPTLGVYGIARASSSEQVDAAAADRPVTAVTATLDQPTTLPPTTEPVTVTVTVTAPEETAPTTEAPTTTEAPPPTSPPRTAPRTTVAVASAAIGDATEAELAFLACTRRIESTNNYKAVDPSGTYFGAYQFHQGTWNGVVQRLGREDLVGLRPSAASPADQDAAALQLYRERGAQPWGGRCA